MLYIAQVVGKRHYEILVSDTLIKIKEHQKNALAFSESLLYWSIINIHWILSLEKDKNTVFLEM